MNNYKVRTIALGASSAALLAIGSAGAFQQDPGDGDRGQMMDNMVEARKSRPKHIKK